MRVGNPAIGSFFSSPNALRDSKFTTLAMRVRTQMYAGRLRRRSTAGARGFEEVNGVGIGASIFLLAVGAVLAWAVNVTTSGVDINMIGVILMIVGAIGLLVSLFVWGPWGFYGDRGDRMVIRDREVIDRDTDHHHHRTIT
jgi:uncharacterized protein DUF6458